MEKTNILFIHQSAELYGSDKTLLFLLLKLDKTKFHPVVLLPFDGPLRIELEKENIKVIIAPVLKLSRKMVTPKNMALFLKEIKTSFKMMDKLNEQYRFDIIYSNTLAVLLGLFYARKRKIQHIWHVHEIIESPKIFFRAFLMLLESKANSKIIYNSFATQKFWDMKPDSKKKSAVIWNGLEIPTKKTIEAEIISIRKELFKSNSNDVIIALVGRISRWKGQSFLLKVFSQLSLVNPNIKLVFVGSTPPNQGVFLENIEQQIKELNVSDKVIIIPFQDEIHKIWESIDIAVVPSIEPEPFGLVAVEAMLAHKPVVAANHGGLTEIVVNNETGYLVEPNNEKTLSEALQKLIENPELRKSFGENGYQIAVKEFSLDKYVSNFEKLFHEVAPPK